jgi:hypothetical protein
MTAGVADDFGKGGPRYHKYRADAANFKNCAAAFFAPLCLRFMPGLVRGMTEKEKEADCVL